MDLTTWKCANGRKHALQWGAMNYVPGVTTKVSYEFSVILKDLFFHKTNKLAS